MATPLSTAHFSESALWSEWISIVSFQSGLNANLVLLGTSVLGIAAGVVGTMSILRKRALMADAIAHCTLPGLALAFLLGTTIGVNGKHLPSLLVGASFTGILGVGLVQWIVRSSRLHEDTAIGVVLSSFFGLGIVLISVIQVLGTGDEGGLSHFIFGQTASLNYDDARLLLLIACLVTIGALIPLKEIRLICFDEDFARSDGWPVHLLDLYLMTLLVVVAVAGLHVVGVLLIVSLLIIPPAAARFWTDRLTTMTLLSAIIGGASGFFGSGLSALLPRLPAGAVITLTAGVFFFCSLLFAPQRGLIASGFRQLRLRLRVLRDHVLREVIGCLAEKNTPFDSSPFPLIRYSELSIAQNWSLSLRIIHSLLFCLRGLAYFSSQGIQLTTKGYRIGQMREKSHHLWEAYLSSVQEELPPSHLDLSADYVEHFISSDILEKLEKRSQGAGQDPIDENEQGQEL